METQEQSIEHAEQYYRDMAIAYGDANYDQKLHLVRRRRLKQDNRPDVFQQSPAYVSALLDAGHNAERADRVIHAILDYQWLQDRGTSIYGSFFRWAGLKKPQHSHAAVFITPWICYWLLEHESRLQPETAARIRTALTHCAEAVQHKKTSPSYDNPFFLKVASLLMLGRVLGRRALMNQAERELDIWDRYVSQYGIDEFNSPTYTAVSTYALEFTWYYTPAGMDSLKEKTTRQLNLHYADIIQNWHREAAIGAGTHSRAYSADRTFGESFNGILFFKQCGGDVYRQPAVATSYAAAVIPYAVPKEIRSFGMPASPSLRLRASHPCWGRKGSRVERSLYKTAEYSLAAQTGYRACVDMAIPFKITYAGSSSPSCASYIRPIPSHDGSRKFGNLQFAHHQSDSDAIVLYEANLKGRQETAFMRLVIDPRELLPPGYVHTEGSPARSENHDPEAFSMLDEIQVNGKPYREQRRRLRCGAVITWRVGNVRVALRLLDICGVHAGDPKELVVRHYVLTRVKGVGLCLHGMVCYRPKNPIRVNNMSCGFLVHVESANDNNGLAGLESRVRKWTVEESLKDGARTVCWQSDRRTMRLAWDGAGGQVLTRETDHVPLDTFPLYESPLVHFDRGDVPETKPVSVKGS